MKKKRIYISGKITGLVYEEAYASFAKAEEYWLSKGWEVVNPMKLEHSHDLSWKEYMRVDLKAMLDCDAIAMLIGWAGSKGARLEYEIAQELYFEEYFQGIDGSFYQNNN